MLKQVWKLVAVAMMLILLPQSSYATEFATKAEAETMVKKVVAYFVANGPEKTYTEISNSKGMFVDRDLYAVAYDLTGKCLAHGSNAKLIGKDLLEIQDADGKAYVKERVDLAKTKNSFWQEYRFSNPISKKIEPKETYCQRQSDILICAGVYK